LSNPNKKIPFLFLVITKNYLPACYPWSNATGFFFDHISGSPHPTKRNNLCYKVKANGQSKPLKDKCFVYLVNKPQSRRARYSKEFSESE
jgi:hypothetical protein